MMKARCLVLKLVQVISPFAVPLSPDWSTVHRGTSSAGCHGLTRDWGGSAGEHVYIFDPIPNEKVLVSMVTLGSTLLHELHHQQLGSFDDGSAADPANVYDNPALTSLGYALTTPAEGCCTIGAETHVIEKLSQRHACDCNIKFW